MTDEANSASQTPVPVGGSLATIVSWLGKPFRVVLGPWWEKLVATKAESQAVRLKLLEAVANFRVADFQRARNLDAERAIGIAHRVVEQIRPSVIADKNMDVCSVDSLRRIEIAIQVHGVLRSSWVELACLASRGQFDPQQYLTVDFLDDAGSKSHSSLLIAVLQTAFPFSRIIAINSPTNAFVAPDGIALLKEYCPIKALPAAEFTIAETRSTLPKGWSPASMG
jgi:hypothetical protein